MSSREPCGGSPSLTAGSDGHHGPLDVLPGAHGATTKRRRTNVGDANNSKTVSPSLPRRHTGKALADISKGSGWAGGRHAPTRQDGMRFLLPVYLSLPDPSRVEPMRSPEEPPTHSAGNP